MSGTLNCDQSYVDTTSGAPNLDSQGASCTESGLHSVQ